MKELGGMSVIAERKAEMDASLQQSACPLPDEKSKPNRSRPRLSNNASLGPRALGWERPRRSLGCPPLVPVVQAADLPYGNNASVLRRVHRPRFGSVLSRGEVSSGFRIITQEQFHMLV